jgi:hypothetical protein
MLGCLTRFGRRQIDSRASRLGQSNRNGLFGGTRAVDAFSDVVHLLLDEFTGLRRGSFALTFICSCSRQRLLLGHMFTVRVFVSPECRTACNRNQRLDTAFAVGAVSHQRIVSAGRGTAHEKVDECAGSPAFVHAITWVLFRGTAMRMLAAFAPCLAGFLRIISEVSGPATLRLVGIRLGIL